MCEKDTAPTMAPSVVVSVRHAVSLAVLWVSGFAEGMVCGCKDCDVLRWSHHCLIVSCLECETAVQAEVVRYQIAIEFIRTDFFPVWNQLLAIRLLVNGV